MHSLFEEDDTILRRLHFREAKTAYGTMINEINTLNVCEESYVLTINYFFYIKKIPTFLVLSKAASGNLLRTSLSSSQGGCKVLPEAMLKSNNKYMYFGKKTLKEKNRSRKRSFSFTLNSASTPGIFAKVECFPSPSIRKG